MSSISPAIKFETSPTDSLLSDPAGVYPSLFSASTSSIASSGAATPVDTTGGEFGEYGQFGDALSIGTKMPMSMMDLAQLNELCTAQMNGEDIQTLQGAAPKTATAAAATEKEEKKTKKRKSWGQVLPQPKTNLPPRKRAKTEDEKEQRRVERVLRNRRAAQSSRERKRLEVDALERRNRVLEAQLAKANSDNLALYAQLCQLQGKPMAAVLPAAAASATPVTLSRQLFGTSALLTSASSSPAMTETIDPLSLSPSLRPVADAANVTRSASSLSLFEPQSPLGRPSAEATDGVSVSVGRGTASAARASHHNTFPASGRPDPFVLGGSYDPDCYDSVYGMAPATINAVAAAAAIAATGDNDNDNSHFAEASAQQSSDYSSCFLGDEDDVNVHNGVMPSLFASVVGPSNSSGSNNNDFDIGDFLNADGLTSASPDTTTPNHTMSRTGSRRDAGECGSDHSHMQEEQEEEALAGADLQPHTGASLVGCDDAGSAVGV